MDNNIKVRRVSLFISGLVGVILGMVFLYNPTLTLETTYIVFGIGIILTGVLLLMDAFSLSKEDKGRSLLIFEGLMFVLFGVMFFLGSTVIGVTVISYMLVFWFMLVAIINMQYSFAIDTGWVKLLSVGLNVLVLAISIYSIFDPQLSVTIMYLSVAWQFLLSGFNKILISILI